MYRSQRRSNLSKYLKGTFLSRSFYQAKTFYCEALCVAFIHTVSLFFPTGGKKERRGTMLRLFGAETRTRTGDLFITNELLYQLSHFGQNLNCGAKICKKKSFCHL